MFARGQLGEDDPVVTKHLPGYGDAVDQDLCHAGAQVIQEGGHRRLVTGDLEVDLGVDRVVGLVKIFGVGDIDVDIIADHSQHLSPLLGFGSGQSGGIGDSVNDLGLSNAVDVDHVLHARRLPKRSCRNLVRVSRTSRRVPMAE